MIVLVAAQRLWVIRGVGTCRPLSPLSWEVKTGNWWTLTHYIFDFKTLFRWISQPYRRKNVSSGLGDRSMQCCCQPDKVFGCERTLQSCWQTCSRETEHKGECTYSAGGAASLTLLAEAARSVSEEGNSPPTIPLFTFQSCYFKWILSYFQCVTVYFSI